MIKMEEATASLSEIEAKCTTGTSCKDKKIKAKVVGIACIMLPKPLNRTWALNYAIIALKRTVSAKIVGNILF